MATHGHIAVPPDGAGKKIHTIEHVELGETVHSQLVHIHDHDVPTNVWAVDNQGAGKITFSEGQPSLDAFGNLRVSSSRLMSSYVYATGNLDHLFTTTTTGAGAATHDDTYSMKRFTVLGAAIDSVSTTTDHYHPYQAGTGMLVIITARLSDNGIAGNVRKWGLFDDDDGLYWELDGTTLSVEIRSTLGGVLDSTPIPRAQWNGDKLDGSGLSGMTIDLSKANFFWIDFAWLGVGTVRFGVLDEAGRRVVCHTFHNPNTNVGPYMCYPTLPIRFDNYNKTALAQGVSLVELGVICAAVYSDNETTPTFKRSADLHGIAPIVANTPVLSLKANIYYSDSPTTWNLGETFIEQAAVYTDVPIRFDLLKNCDLTGTNWNQPGLSSLSGGTGGTFISGENFASWYLNSGCHNLNVGTFFDETGLGIHTNADDTVPEWTFLATPIITASGNAAVRVIYKELR